MKTSNSWVSDASPALTSAVVRRDRRMFVQTSTCRVMMTVAALAGLVFETVDYEMTYAGDRTHDNCKEEGRTETLRWMNVALTALACVFSCLGHITANEARQHNLLSFKSRHNHLFYFFIPRGRIGLSLLLDLAILSLFPYPYLNGHVRLTEHQNTKSVYKWTDVCYTFSEVLYLCSFARLYFLGRNLLHLIGYTDSHSRIICKENRVRANVSFTLRSLVRLKPLRMALVFILPTALVFGVFLRVFERPYMDVSGLDYEPYYNSLWLSLMTITTVNYADFFPTTHLGRVVALFCGLWGFFLVSMMVYIIDRNFSLSSKEEKTLFKIKRTRAAAKLLISGLAYYHAKINLSQAEIDYHYFALRKAAQQYHRDRVELKAAKNDVRDETRPLHDKIKSLKESLDRLESLLRDSHRPFDR